MGSGEIPETGEAPSDADGAALTYRIRRGDEVAFGAFYDLWFDRCLGLAKRTTRRDESFCLDVVQDVMMRVVRSIPELADGRAVRAWMARTVFTTSIDAVRKDARRSRREREAATPESVELPEIDDRIDWLRRRLRDLPDEERALIVQRFEGDVTLEALGREFGMTGDAAHGRVRRLVLRLRRAAQEVFG